MVGSGSNKILANERTERLVMGSSDSAHFSLANSWTLLFMALSLPDVQAEEIILIYFEVNTHIYQNNKCLNINLNLYQRKSDGKKHCSILNQEINE